MKTNRIGRAPLCAIACAALAAVFAVPAAQASQAAAKLGLPESSSCFASFATPGSFQFATCVSDHGNVMQFNVQGREHIRAGSFTEGYAVCTPGGTNYWDIGDMGESGWGAPLIAQPNGPNTLPLTITRLTTDGKLHLGQTYSVDLLRNRITVIMKLTNVSGVTIPALQLSRSVDIDINSAFNDTQAATSLGIIAYQLAGGGLALTANTAGPTITSSVGDFTTAFPGGDCAPAGNSFVGDGAGKVTYELGELKHLHSHTLKYMYTAY